MIGETKCPGCLRPIKQCRTISECRERLDRNQFTVEEMSHPSNDCKGPMNAAWTTPDVTIFVGSVPWWKRTSSNRESSAKSWFSRAFDGST